MRKLMMVGVVLGLVLPGCESTVDQSPDPTTSSFVLSTPIESVAPSPTLAATPSPTLAITPSPTPADTPRPTDSVFSCANGDADSSLVAYADSADLWLYDVQTDERRRLIGDGDTRWEHDPTFLSRGCLVYASTQPPTIEVLDLAGGLKRTIVEEVGSIGRLDVSPDGESVLYLHIDYDVDATFRLKRIDISGGAPEIVHTFHASLGRGAGSEDEVSVAWSPDGTTILVANTHEYTRARPRGAIYLFDQTGRETLGRWTGTHPRWAPDGRTIYYRGYAGEDGQRWYALDVRTMQATKLGISPGTNNLVVSPDGRWVAYDTSWFGDLPLEARIEFEAPKVYVYDLTTGTEALLKRGALGPLWISATEIVVTNARERGRRSLSSWESLGTVTKLSVDGERIKVDMSSTLFDSAVYLGT